MRRFLGRIIICLVPTILSIAIVAWACYQYSIGQGGFRLGVDLVGGTVLVYEVDERKMPENFKATDLAAALKRRIDPNDLYNITIRPLEGNPPRVEIILPTGGRYQAEAAQRAWEGVLQAAADEFPIEGNDNPYSGVERGRLAADLLKARILEENKKAGNALDPTKVEKWVDDHTTRSSSRALTGDEVENIKSLISKQGRLEFKILANENDDEEAIKAARAFMANPKNKAALESLNNKALPPPPPQHETGGRNFTARVKSGEESHTYDWVLLGKSELYSLGLNSDSLAQTPELEEALEEKRASGEAFTPEDLETIWRGKLDENLKKNPQDAAAIAQRGRKGSKINHLHRCLLYTRKIPTDLYTWGLESRPLEDKYQGKTVEYFVLVRNGIEVKGDDLVRAQEEHGGGRQGGGGRAISFMFNAEGGDRFYELTSANVPTKDSRGSFYRKLAILFDNQVVSAPNLNEAIRTNGQITGDFSQQEINDMVRILRAGALPASLKRDPVSQNSMGATLGEDTIQKGTWSVLWAFVAVLAFMVFYYRFAGFVACVALFANLLLTVAFMVLVNAAFTLPGLAGLVLMLGMAVDANVLIYERLREERDRGATLGQALRNGYERALPTILDTHLSSIFTAIVLYVVGNDQLKGFGISLTVGLVISLFTSLYMTRTMFEVWMDEGWLKELNFFEGLVKLVHLRYWDFMSVRHYWFAATAALTVLGAVLFLYRADSDPAAGKATVLNIDFTGGVAITTRLSEPHSLAWLRERLDGTKGDSKPLPDMAIEQLFITTEKKDNEDKAASSTDSDVFTLRTSEKDLGTVQRYVVDRLGEENLKHLDLDFKPLNESVVMNYPTPVSGRAVRLSFESPRKVARKERDTNAKIPDAEKIDARAWPPLSQIRDALRAEARGAGAPAAGFELVGVEPLKDEKGQPKGDYFSVMELRLKEEMDAGKVKAWLAAAKKRLAAPRMAPADKTVVELYFTSNGKKDFASPGPIQDRLNEAFTVAGRSKFILERPVDPQWRDKASGLYSRLDLRLRDEMDPAELNEILESVGDKLKREPGRERLEHFDSQLAASIQQRAIIAIVASWIAILLFLWFRFGSWTFGAATVVCLIHDLFFTLGCVAVCHYLYEYAYPVAYVLGIGDFKIDLAAVAALLTLVGYSVNDTIVVFDRIREVRGKNPLLTFQMINDSVNQTLTRTILASATVLVVVLVLYIWGGEGVKLFAFVMIVGVFVGTYSSIYIASPLLVIFGEGTVPAAQERPVAATRG